MKQQASPPSEMSDVGNSAQAHYSSVEISSVHAMRKDDWNENDEQKHGKHRKIGSTLTEPYALSSSSMDQSTFSSPTRQSALQDSRSLTTSSSSSHNPLSDKQTQTPHLSSARGQRKYMGRQDRIPEEERTVSSNYSSSHTTRSGPHSNDYNTSHDHQIERETSDHTTGISFNSKYPQVVEVQAEGSHKGGKPSGHRDQSHPYKQIHRHALGLQKSHNKESSENERSLLQKNLYPSESRDGRHRYIESIDHIDNNQIAHNIQDRATDSFRFHSPSHQSFNQYERQGQHDFNLLPMENKSELSSHSTFQNASAPNVFKRHTPLLDHRVERSAGSSKGQGMALSEDQKDEEDSTTFARRDQSTTHSKDPRKRNSFGSSSSSLTEFRNDHANLSHAYQRNSTISMPISSEISSSSADHIPHQQTSGRTASFMSSLMRAANTPDPQTPTIVHSPMSIHSIMGNRSSSPLNSNADRKTRKRRTSSVQEPLQGSALEAASRARSSPRLSDYPQRSSMPLSRSMHTDVDLYSRENQSRADLQRSSFQPFETNRRDFYGDRSGIRQSLPGAIFHQSSFVSQRRAGEDAFIQPQIEAKSEHPHSRSDQRFHSIDTSFRHYGHSRSSASPRSTYILSGSQSEGERMMMEPNSNAPVTPKFYGAQAAFEPEISFRGAEHHRSFTDSSHGSRSTDPIVTYPVRSPVEKLHSSEGSIVPYQSSMREAGKSDESTQGVEPMQWSDEISSQAINEQKRWSFTPLPDKRRHIKQSVWDARIHLRTGSSYWPPMASNVTTIRCMYANIAQKSYGSEKRFLCPPPSVKINGPFRPCKWVSMRVISGDSVTPSVGMISTSSQTFSTGQYGKVGSSSIAVTPTGGGEESSLLDANGEAKFGKLHVGSVSDPTNKVFRLQVNLLRADLPGEEVKAAFRNTQEISGPLRLPCNAWSTFHSAPINVISKPARKSVRTRAASPAIASGSVVCLYNRLNSQTVRTKYLGVETGAIEDVSQVEVARRLVARQDGWEGFSIELLARPINDPPTARVNNKSFQTGDWGIMYGSIVCLRDVNTKLCSDPMLICKVDKGKVELSNIFGSKTGQLTRFQITSKNREEARQILFGGSRGDIANPKDDLSNSEQYLARERASGMPSLASLTSAMKGERTPKTAQIDSANSENSSIAGGPVIQMQKITLMHITPLPNRESPDIVECDLSSARSYLCSTVNENTENESSLTAIARSSARLRSRSLAVRQGQPRLPIEEFEAHASPSIPRGDKKSNSPTRSMQTGSPTNTSVGATNDYFHSLQTQSAPVGFARPPALINNSSSQMNNPSQIDLLEDQFCWTIVTISCTEVSYIEANANLPQIAKAKGGPQNTHKIRSELRSPHVPLDPLPVTPYPCFAALPSYDVRSHSMAATIHDYLFADDLDSTRTIFNSVSAIHAFSKKAAHEIWLGHSEPLQTHASSAGPHVSDVTIKLPGMEELMSLHIEFHANSSDERSLQQLKTEGTSLIRLPIVFVRVGQGISFPSGHWLLAEYGANPLMGMNARSPYDPMAWSIRII